MQQKRFVLALTISAAILFGWNYLFPPRNIQQNNPNNSSTAQQQAEISPTPPPPQPTAAIQTDQQAASNEAVNATPDTAPPRIVTIKTPLYEAKLDSRGAILTSWIINKNKENGQKLCSVASTKQNCQPLELVSQEGLKREPREAPLRLVSGDKDASIDTALVSRNYTVSGVEGERGDALVDLQAGQSQRVELVMRDEATNLYVKKSITFNADNYGAVVEITLNRDNKPLNDARMIIGPSIGDQGIAEYSFYSVAPEGVAVANGEVVRIHAATVHKNEGGWFSAKRPEGADREIVPGAINWAGVGDTYFAMVAVPPKPLAGLEYRTTSYEHHVNNKKEERYLLNALVPIPVDGAPTQLYVGPKDHTILTVASANINKALGGIDANNRQIDLEGLINYGWLSGMRRFLAVPILQAINALQRLTGSYGVAIILFTIFIYSLFFPLKWQSSKKMKKAQKYAPRMKELQEKLKGMKQDDPRMKELQMEQLRLMKEANPLGGCLPLLIQMPFLFALYSAITISIDFRQAAFLWIPDLSAAEPTMIHILPILMAASMIVLQLITPQPSADPLQRKMMAIGMPLFMLYILWSAPAGLLVYWLVGNIVGFSQQFLINHLTKSEDDPEPPGEKKIDPRPPKKLNPARVSQA